MNFEYEITLKAGDETLAHKKETRWYYVSDITEFNWLNYFTNYLQSFFFGSSAEEKIQKAGSIHVTFRVKIEEKEGTVEKIYPNGDSLKVIDVGMPYSNKLRDVTNEATTASAQALNAKLK